MSQAQTHAFQTEVKQLLRLMIHSLYSNPEVFLRELISNASDACDKLRFEALADDGLYEDDKDLRVRVSFDSEAKTVTIDDNGIGMNHEEVVEHIGTIAHSGTKAFLEQLEADKQKDANQIGQFGVGFYSAFIVADHVELTTRRAGVGAEHGVRWTSTGEGEYTIETVDKPERGTRIVLHLREDQQEFADDFRLRSVIRKYSDHINFPVQMWVAPKTEKDDEGNETETPGRWETVNDANALWTRPKSEITDEEYTEFYKHVSHDWEPPLAWAHNQVEGKVEYTSLLYVPKRAPFDLFEPEQSHGVKLYVKRVFIMDDADKLMPRYLRFVRGVIDSADLPLNVSREILQSNRVLDTIRSGSVKRVLSLLEQMAKNEPEKFAEFWQTFGRVLKEGIGEDFANKEKIAGLLRFASTKGEGSAETVSLADYIERMPEDQDEIYYIIADSYQAALASPHLEIFRKKGIEVLLLSDRVDEWVMAHLTEFDGKTLKSVTKATIDVDEDDEDESEEKQEHEALIQRLKDTLGEEVKDVRRSRRLVDSPACLVTDEGDVSLHLQRILEQAGQSMPETKPILEINPDHRLLQQAEGESDEARFADIAHVLYGQAMLAEGGKLADSADFVSRLNRLLA
ncbi:molecular chaperone HtpG [Guyparkeria halophila]|uniref:Chaperone protein HtpG n=1 Tax=Guyparkeria halophila TaxID=47960 RepID=A0A6I6D533_9GAMM|nr:molecular chaperone HtpG [Guyparkeria halophila]QGT79113.1 molecular chaperone HtpG [Guyparkeria halophila]